MKVYRRPATPEPPERQHIKKIACTKVEKPFCGFSGSDDAYEHPPRTAFQARCRAKGTRDIQHITPIFKDIVVERIVSISLTPGSDHKSWSCMIFWWL